MYVMTYQVIWCRRLGDLCPTVWTSFVISDLASIGSEPTCETGVTIRVAAGQDIWLVERLDADLALYETSHVLDMFLKGFQQRWRLLGRHYGE